MSPQLEQLLDQAHEASDEGQFERVLQLSEQAMALDAECLEAKELKAVALTELGRLDEADETWSDLLAQVDDDPGIVLSAAHSKLRAATDEQRELIDEALSLVEPLTRSKDDEIRFDANYLSALGLNQSGEVALAERAARAALKLQPEHPDALLELAFALFEQARFAEAEKLYRQVVTLLPDDPTPHYHLGLIAERRGEQAASEHFAKAQSLDPEAFPAPVQLSEADFDAAVQAAIDRLPEQAREPLKNATIAVEPLPNDADLDGGRLSPTMLGIFHGTPVDERLATEAAHHTTAVIKLFQNNLERFARSKEELVEQIGVTLLHEVGHLMGLDEDELYERGLD